MDKRYFRDADDNAAVHQLSPEDVQRIASGIEDGNTTHMDIACLCYTVEQLRARYVGPVPETPAEVDAYLRAHGYDPDEVGKRFARLAAAGLHNEPPAPPAAGPYRAEIGPTRPPHDEEYWRVVTTAGRLVAPVLLKEDAERIAAALNAQAQP